MDALRDIDALVAEHVMKTPFTKPTHGTCCTCQTCGHDNDGDCQCGYSDDIYMAWKVVEALAKKGHALALQAPGSTDMNERYRQFDQWTAEFQMGGEARADTAPLAICLAALAAVGYPLTERTRTHDQA